MTSSDGISLIYGDIGLYITFDALIVIVMLALIGGAFTLRIVSDLIEFRLATLRIRAKVSSPDDPTQEIKPPVPADQAFVGPA